MPRRTSTFIDRTLDAIGRKLAGKLNSPSTGYQPFTPSDFETLCRTLRPGDVLLVEGRERVSNAIKYLTQSTWSHAAMYVGDRLEAKAVDGEPHRLVEVNLGEGCVSAPLSKYARYNTRICRPVGLSRDEQRAGDRFHAGKAWPVLRHAQHLRSLAVLSADAACPCPLAQADACDRLG